MYVHEINIRFAEGLKWIRDTLKTVLLSTKQCSQDFGNYLRIKQNFRPAWCAKQKVCLKLGSVDLTATELTSIKALVESMNSEIEFISTSSQFTVKSAEELNIEVSVLENKVPMPEFNGDQEKVNQELEKH